MSTGFYIYHLAIRPTLGTVIIIVAHLEHVRGVFPGVPPVTDPVHVLQDPLDDVCTDEGARDSYLQPHAVADL